MGSNPTLSANLRSFVCNHLDRPRGFSACDGVQRVGAAGIFEAVDRGNVRMVFVSGRTAVFAGGIPTTPSGSLDVFTTSLRKQFFDSFTVSEHCTSLIVTTVVNDPNYVTNGFVISSHVKEEIDLSKWTPRPCDVPPRVFRSGRAQ